MGPMERPSLLGGNARKFKKLLLSLLSHIGKNGEVPRIRTEFSPVKSRDFAAKFATRTRHESRVEPSSRFRI